VPEPDEDLVTPEHLLHQPRGLLFFLPPAEDLAATAARAAVAWLAEPENIAGTSGAMLLPLLVFRGRRVPLIPFFIAALMGDQVGRMAWRASRNLQVIAEAAAGQVPDVSTVKPGAGAS